ncbi:hypothetical protein Dvina_20665 [Dactylosporangium vinaceum]|uniref:Uncharacterized protein n=1 Tax=Dactylosporangium vinaceum TaxID=53362 RepID=A0ABV5MS26_9ACTN|nr:hypothetical protein [Dactylosporangium vinaceum]UAC00261.1 hypothetical protein Dvina_20665 [Dactylosporangium vinaceum]
MSDLAVCLSRSCTTGWLDWIHGELWLAQDRLIRRRLGLGATVRNEYGPTVVAPLPSAPAASFDDEALLAGHPTNRVIRFDEVAAADLVRGLTCGALRVQMRDGRRHKLLWLNRDPAGHFLAGALPVALGGRVRVG